MFTKPGWELTSMALSKLTITGTGKLWDMQLVAMPLIMMVLILKLTVSV